MANNKHYWVLSDIVGIISVHKSKKEAKKFANRWAVDEDFKLDWHSAGSSLYPHRLVSYGYDLQLDRVAKNVKID